MKTNFYSIFLLLLFFAFGCSTKKNNNNSNSINLVSQNTWFIAGPTIENQNQINATRIKNNVIRVTASKNPVGEIELNVPISNSLSNDGKPIDLAKKSTYVTITYQSTQEIKLQAREGNLEGTGCQHGGSHPRTSLPASPNSFKTIHIKWADFKQDELPDGKKLDIHNLCKFNFVNYSPVTGATLQIKSVRIQNFN